MRIEYWKFIPGYDFNYMVSDQGRVLSLNYHRTGKIQILKQKLSTKGYLQVNLHVGGKGKWPLVHRLVAFAFIPNPHNYTEVNHKNEIKTDNSVENLEWCDAKYNNNFGTRNEKAAATQKNRQDQSKPVIQYSLGGEIVASYLSAHEAERQTGIWQTQIVQCCLNRPRYKSAGGFKWAYA